MIYRYVCTYSNLRRKRNLDFPRILVTLPYALIFVTIQAENNVLKNLAVPILPKPDKLENFFFGRYSEKKIERNRGVLENR